MQLENGFRGLVDEVGEIANIIKKHIEYGQEMDWVNLLEEVGDSLWRLAQIANAGGFTLEDSMRSNITKLKTRYPTQYSDLNAQEESRDREKERQDVEAFLNSETGVN